MRYMLGIIIIAVLAFVIVLYLGDPGLKYDDA